MTQALTFDAQLPLIVPEHPAVLALCSTFETRIGLSS
jgi:hypothetical protein